MNELTQLPNIGKASADLLGEAGIRSYDDLVSIGSRDAWLRTRQIDPGT
ncbi:MAG: TfoX/Sxy family protein [Coriobacteriia bacterium]|nr:TfoX/Sxy family protein [Coriobacteriia bacterium]